MLVAMLMVSMLVAMVVVLAVAFVVFIVIGATAGATQPLRTSPRRAGLLTSGFTPHLRLHSALTRLRWGAPQASLGVAAASGEVFTVKPQ